MTWKQEITGRKPTLGFKKSFLDCLVLIVSIGKKTKTTRNRKMEHSCLTLKDSLFFKYFLRGRI